MQNSHHTSSNNERWFVILAEPPISEEEKYLQFALVQASCFDEACSVAQDQLDDDVGGGLLPLTAFSESDLRQILVDLAAAKLSDDAPAEMW